MKKRIAGVLGIAAALSVGVTAPASAAGDPLNVELGQTLCGVGLPLCPTEFSAEGLLGPAVGDAVCTPSLETRIPLGGELAVTVCKQPS